MHYVDFSLFGKTEKHISPPPTLSKVLLVKKQNKTRKSKKKKIIIIHLCDTVLPTLAVESVEKIGRKYGQDGLSREMEKV